MNIHNIKENIYKHNLYIYKLRKEIYYQNLERFIKLI